MVYKRHSNIKEMLLGDIQSKLMRPVADGSFTMTKAGHLKGCTCHLPNQSKRQMNVWWRMQPVKSDLHVHLQVLWGSLYWQNACTSQKVVWQACHGLPKWVWYCCQYHSLCWKPLTNTPYAWQQWTNGLTPSSPPPAATTIMHSPSPQYYGVLPHPPESAVGLFQQMWAPIQFRSWHMALPIMEFRLWSSLELYYIDLSTENKRGE